MADSTSEQAVWRVGTQNTDMQNTNSSNAGMNTGQSIDTPFKARARAGTVWTKNGPAQPSGATISTFSTGALLNALPVVAIAPAPVHSVAQTTNTPVKDLTGGRKSHFSDEDSSWTRYLAIDRANGVVDGVLMDSFKYPAPAKSTHLRMTEDRKTYVLRFDDLNDAAAAFTVLSDDLKAQLPDIEKAVRYFSVTKWMRLPDTAGRITECFEGNVLVIAKPNAANHSAATLKRMALEEAKQFGDIFADETLKVKSATAIVRVEFFSVKAAVTFQAAFSVRTTASVNNAITLEVSFWSDKVCFHDNDYPLHNNGFIALGPDTPVRVDARTPVPFMNLQQGHASTSGRNTSFQHLAMDQTTSDSIEHVFGTPQLHNATNLPQGRLPGNSMFNGPVTRQMAHAIPSSFTMSMASGDPSAFNASSQAVGMPATQPTSAARYQPLQYPAYAGYAPPTTMGQPSSVSMSSIDQMYDPIFAPSWARRPRQTSFPVDIPRIIRGEDCRTTVMLRNIPNRATCHDLKALLDETSRGKYDFSYLRIDFTNGLNVGYAFVNFLEPAYIVDFAARMQGADWPGFQTSKRAEVSYATKQGLQTLVDAFRNSAVRLENADYRPKLWYTIEDGPLLCRMERELPDPDNATKLQRSKDSRIQVGLFPPRNRVEVQPAATATSYLGSLGSGPTSPTSPTFVPGMGYYYPASLLGSPFR